MKNLNINGSEDDVFTNGQPKRSAAKKKSVATKDYIRGRTDASLKQQREQLQQEIQLSTLQQVMLQNAKSSLQDILAEVNRKQSDIMAMGGMGGGMPMTGEIPPEMGGGMPPIPQGPMGAPPPEEMGGQPMPADFAAGGQPMPADFAAGGQPMV